MEKKFDVKKEVAIHLVTDEGPTKGWVHTHGLAAHGLPELEIRGVPLFMAIDAKRLLHKVADHMLHTEKKIELGDTMAVSHETAKFAFEKLPLLDDTHAEERWTLTDAPFAPVPVEG